MGRGSVAALGVMLSSALLANPLAVRAGSAVVGFADPALAVELRQLASRLARSLPKYSEPLYLITSIDEEISLASSNRCRVVHVTAASKGAAIATAQAIACPSQAGWTLRDEAVRYHN